MGLSYGIIESSECIDIRTTQNNRHEATDRSKSVCVTVSRERGLTGSRPMKMAISQAHQYQTTGQVKTQSDAYKSLSDKRKSLQKCNRSELTSESTTACEEATKVK